MTGRAGQRVVFGCSAALRHTLSPEHGALTFAAKSELTQHWLVAITLRVARDWSWDGLAATSFEVRDATNNRVGSVDVNDGIGLAALDHPDRTGTDLAYTTESSGVRKKSTLPVFGVPGIFDFTVRATDFAGIFTEQRCVLRVVGP